MFDVGFTELVLLFVIGLLILGPERLPRVASQIGRWVGRARRTANQLRHQLEREVALEEMTRSQRRRESRDTAGGESSTAAAGGGEAPPDEARSDAPGDADAARADGSAEEGAAGEHRDGSDEAPGSRDTGREAAEKPPPA